jgi:hypothetical protein
MLSFKEYMYESDNMDHHKDNRAVDELKAALLSRKKEIQDTQGDQDKVYSIINKLMTAIAKAHNISNQKIHDMWVDEYKEIPDTWIMNEESKYKSPTGGLTRAGVDKYNRENPGHHLKMAVTTKPSKLKPGSKAANRRKSFCARMGGMKRRLTSAKTAHDPDSRINKALRKWNC